MKKPMAPPPRARRYKRLAEHPDPRRVLAVGATPTGKYLHWDELRHRTPPDGLSHEDWWLGVAFAREQLHKELPLFDKSGRRLRYATPDLILRALHEIDQQASGRIQLAEEVTSPGARERYIVNSLIAESITSSQLEGASTTADVARTMLRSGRRPTDRSEQMILNNYRAMTFVRGARDEALSPNLVFELHRIVTDRTLDDPTKAGKFREADDEIQVVEPLTGTTLHIPPPAGELLERLKGLCSFANEQTSEVFIHPVVRAIVLHFVIGYDHPFVDGNGRTARALFYWSMLRQGYWLAEFLSISRILKEAPTQYGMSYLHAETDANDVTYFIDYQLDVIRRATSDLSAYLEKKTKELRKIRSILNESSDLNYRQLALLSHALKRPPPPLHHRITPGESWSRLSDGADGSLRPGRSGPPEAKQGGPPVHLRG